MSTRLIQYDNIPAWYLFTYDPEKKAFVIGVRKDVAEKIEPISADSPLMVYLQSIGVIDLLHPFHPSFGEKFGIGDSIVRIGENKGFYIYESKIPKIINVKGICKSCGGRGENEDGITCFRCKKGEEIDYDWTEAYNLALSLKYMFWQLDRNFEHHQPEVMLYQPMTIHTVAEMSSRGAELGGNLSRDFSASLMILLMGSRSQMIRNSMVDLWSYMMMTGKESHGDIARHEIRIEENDCNLSIRCPGQATFIYPSNGAGTWKEGEGYEFSSHNVDHFGQQFTLLAGLGMLYGYYMKDLEVHIL